MTDFSSRLMVGEIRHRRFAPKTHSLTYPVFMPCINLDDIDVLQQSVFGFGCRWWHWARFKESDYLGCNGNVKAAVIEVANVLTCQKLDPKKCQVMAIVNLRYLGLYFSPVNFYYLYDQSGEWNCLVAEVSNTPWNERHCYALKAGETTLRCKKQFHVSPFNPIGQDYLWRVKPLGDSLSIHIECHRDAKEFDATLAMKSQPFQSRQLLHLLARTPSQSVKMLIGIYWHAFLLWRKGVPIYDHP